MGNREDKRMDGRLQGGSTVSIQQYPAGRAGTFLHLSLFHLKNFTNQISLNKFHYKNIKISIFLCLLQNYKKSGSVQEFFDIIALEILASFRLSRHVPHIFLR